MLGSGGILEFYLYYPKTLPSLFIMKLYSKQVSVVVCTKNVEDIIKDCIDSVIINNPKEVIIVDGCSTDKTLEKINKHEVTILCDENKGLSFARKIGSEKASGDYILFIGPDNILDKNFIEKYIKNFKKYKFDSATTFTRVKNPLTIWDKGLDQRWKSLISKPGLREIIGTPGLYKKECFEKVSFSSQDLGPCDDTLFSQRLLAAGFTIGVVPLTIYDQNNSNFKTTWERFKWYGTGDYKFFTYNMKDWSFQRKIKSILHPYIQFLVHSFMSLKQFNFIGVFFCFFTMLARYFGWLSMLIKN
jgi:glycosyltransferase involved in cell wall biosynthesis